MRIYFNNKKLYQGTLVGLDLATKSGYAIIKVDASKVNLVGYGSIKIPRHSNDILRLETTANTITNIIKSYLCQGTSIITIEDCFLAKWNPRTFGFLSRLSGYVASSIYNEFRNCIPLHHIKLIPPSTAKKLVGLKGNCSKEETIKFVNSLLKRHLFREIHNNITDAIVLALAGGVNDKQSIL